MCGRYTLALLPEHLQEVFKITGRLPPPARYNIAPTRDAPIVGFNPNTEQRGLVEMRWGFVPHWTKDVSIGSKTFNARAESLMEKPSFKPSLKHKRCIVPASGFYAWYKQDKAKQPYYFTRQDDTPLGMAGLWAIWKHDGQELHSFTIITTQAKAEVRPVHERMPVILELENFAVWLDPEMPEEAALDFLKTLPAAEMRKHRISQAINRSVMDGAELIQAVDLNSK